jgi:hypothetical protein
MDGGTCNPLDGGPDAPMDTSTRADLLTDRPPTDGSSDRSGDVLFVPAACSPVGSNGQLDIQAAGGLVVAPDQKHVAFVRDPHRPSPGCAARIPPIELGTLVVLELQSDVSTCQRVVAKDVSSSSIFFSSDSRYLAFMEGVDGCGVGKLQTADADGANVRPVQESALNIRGIGSTVFFRVQDQDFNFAAPFAGGKIVTLDANSDDPALASNASGTAFVYEKSDPSAGVGSLVLVALPSGKSQTLADGAAERFGFTHWSPGGGWLAFSHTAKDAGTLSSLTLVSADGSSRIEVSSTSTSYSSAFSPDEAWLLYAEISSASGSRVLSYSLEDRSSLLLGTLPENDFWLKASDDSTRALVTVTSRSPATPSDRVYVGTVGVASSLQLLVDEPGISAAVSAGGYVALSTSNWKSSPGHDDAVEVYPISGGTPVILQGVHPLFEPGVAQPHLLLRQYSPNAIALASTDGTGVTTHVVSDAQAFASWLGSVAVYGVISDTNALATLSALTNAGAVTTPLASEAGAYAWAPIAAPTRIFYSRKATSAGGAAGLFYTELPR